MRQSFRHATRALMLLAAFSAFIGCGSGGSSSSNSSSNSTSGGENTGGSDSSGPGPITGGTTVTPATRKAVVAATEAKWQTLLDTVDDRATREQQIALFLRQQTGIRSAVIGQFGDVTATFLDNSKHLILDGDYTPKDGSSIQPDNRSARNVDRSTSNFASSATQRSARLPYSDVTSPLPVTRATSGAVTRADAKPGDMPSENKAHIMMGMGAGFPTTNSDIIGMLTDHGYNVTVQRATIENLRTVSGDSVFFIYTHGGLGRSEDGNSVWWTMWTDNKVTDANNALYAADIKDGSLVTATAVEDVVNNKWVSGTHYMLTSTFIYKYKWGFAPHSMAFMNACSSAASGMTSTMRGLAQPASQTYGWSDTMRTDKGELSAQFIFDRLLGANKLIPEVPTQRAFNGTEAYDNAGLRKFADGSTLLDATFEAGHTCTLVEKHTDADLVLSPSIMNMEMSERIGESPLHGATKLTLHGLFGSDQDTVKVGGVEVPIVSWKKDEIVCTPADVPGSGYSGDVQVISKERKGNTVSLTEWHGKLTYDIDILPSIVATGHSRITCDLHFRADLHTYRMISRGDLIQPEAVKFRVSQGSTAHWQVLGNPPPMATWSGPLSADLPFGLNGTVNPPYGTGFIVSGIINAKAKTVSMSFNFLGCVTGYAAGPSGQPVATIHDPTLTSQASGIDTTSGYPLYSNNLAALLGDTFEVIGKTFTGTTPVFNPKLTLDDLLPTHQPDPAKGEDNSI